MSPFVKPSLRHNVPLLCDVEVYSCCDAAKEKGEDSEEMKKME